MRLETRGYAGWLIGIALLGCGKGDGESGEGPGTGGSGRTTAAMTLVKARVKQGTAHIDVATTEDIYGLDSKHPEIGCDRELGRTLEGATSFDCRLGSAPFGKLELTVEYTARSGTGRLVIPLDHRPYLMQQGSDFTCVGIECKGKTDTTEAELVAADGTKLTYGGVSAVVTGGKPARVQPDLWPEIQKLTLAELRDRKASQTIKIPLAITFANGVVIDGEHRISRQNLLAWVASYLERATQGPVLFPGEAATGGGNALLAVYGSSSTELYGDAAKLTDIGRVSVRTQTRRGAPCGKYVGDKASEATEYGLVFIDETYTIYDRRTGKQLATRRFPAEPKACPASFRSDGYREALISSPDPDAVIAWLREQAG